MKFNRLQFVLLVGIIVLGILIAVYVLQRSTSNNLPLENIIISPDFPVDIYEDGTPASKSNLIDASIFAWREFIALNWPATEGTRGTPDLGAVFGDMGGTPVWLTHRSKVELFPGRGNPPGYDPSLPDYGYNTLPPQYNYGEEIPACDPLQQNNIPPYINLDENGQILQDTLHAGVLGTGTNTSNQFLYTAKGNDVQYAYLAENGIYITLTGDDLKAIFDSTKIYVLQNQESPPAGIDANPPESSGETGLFSFPSGVIENKAGWRRLTQEEVNSGRYFTAPVRYYQRNDNNDICFRDSNMEDDVWGLISLHIIHKTPTAPYFTYATFSQADNILDAEGNPVEDENGKIHPEYQGINALEPEIQSTMGHLDEDGNFVPQVLTPPIANCPDDDNRLRYVNTSVLKVIDKDGEHDFPFVTPQGTICINRRIHPIPDDVIAVNEAFHTGIRAYNAENGLEDSPWLYYKLVNIQWQPLHKDPGVVYTGEDRATYYLANTVVESNYNLQTFSGTSQFDYRLDEPFGGLGTDYGYDSPDKKNWFPIFNVRYNQQEYNMGGCMGCHGAVQQGGQDFSFMTQDGPVCEPEVAGDAPFYKDCHPLPQDNEE